MEHSEIALEIRIQFDGFLLVAITQTKVQLSKGTRNKVYNTVIIKRMRDGKRGRSQL